MFMCRLTTVAALLGLAVVGAGVASSSVTGAAVVAVGAVVALGAVVAVGAVVATGEGLATATGDGLATTGAAAEGQAGSCAGTGHVCWGPKNPCRVRSAKVRCRFGGSEAWLHVVPSGATVNNAAHVGAGQLGVWVLCVCLQLMQAQAWVDRCHTGNRHKHGLTGVTV